MFYSSDCSISINQYANKILTFCLTFNYSKFAIIDISKPSFQIKQLAKSKKCKK